MLTGYPFDRSIPAFSSLALAGPGRPSVSFLGTAVSTISGTIAAGAMLGVLCEWFPIGGLMGISGVCLRRRLLKILEPGITLLKPQTSHGNESPQSLTTRLMSTAVIHLSNAQDSTGLRGIAGVRIAPSTSSSLSSSLMQIQRGPRYVRPYTPASSLTSSDVAIAEI